MSRHRSLAVLLVVLAAVLCPWRASAAATTNAQTRVGDFHLIVRAFVGAQSLRSAENHRAIERAAYDFASSYRLAAEAGGAIRVASGGGASAPATLVREIQHGERVANIVQEAAELTYESGGLEHAVISTQSGQRLLLQGGAGGMSFEGFAVRRVLGHTHPMPTGPSGADFTMLQQLGQRSSWIYELFGGGLTRFRSH